MRSEGLCEQMLSADELLECSTTLWQDRKMQMSQGFVTNNWLVIRTEFISAIKTKFCAVLL